MSKVIPWSWSTLEAYETCPKQFYELRIAKSVVQPQTQDLVWGNHVHKCFEENIRDGKAFPENAKIYAPIAEKFRNAPGIKYVEQSLAVDSELKPCGFWDYNAWNRGKDDLVIINGSKAIDIDWKTGKEKKYSGQLEISAMRVFAHFPEVQVVHAAFAWLQTKNWTRATFIREDYEKIWSSYYERIAKMIWSEENNVWSARPSGLCKRSKKVGSTYGGCPVTNCPHSENYRK